MSSVVNSASFAPLNTQKISFTVKKHPSSSKVEVMHVYYPVIIWVFRNSVCPLKMMHRGSILHNRLSFATLVLIFCSILPIQSILTSAKWAKLREIVGEVEEEEPEGEAVAAPSGEATVHSSGNTPPVPPILIVINLCVHIFFFFFSAHNYCIFYS